MGAAVCWELIRTQTARRLSGVDVVMTGTHWWTVPNNWGPLVRGALGSLAQYNRYLSEQAPSSSLCGWVHRCCRRRTAVDSAPTSPRAGVDLAVPYETSFVGATQIVAADGSVLASRNTADGPGVVVADVEIGGRPPLRATEDRFWIPALPAALRAYWHQQNLAAKSYYRRHGRAAGLRAAAQPTRVNTTAPSAKKTPL